jgi:hypothetical protein
MSGNRGPGQMEPLKPVYAPLPEDERHTPEATGLRERLTALADEWDHRHGEELTGDYGTAFADGMQHAAAELRAVLGGGESE